MDKGYDAEWLHQFFASLKVRSIAPVRKGARRGRYRKKLRDNFPEKLYHKRSIVESVIHALKQRFGGHIGSKYMCSARTEMYVRAILYNMSMLLRRLLGQSLCHNNPYIPEKFIDSKALLGTSKSPTLKNRQSLIL
tara:strand:- start:59 stop:466 length:408 start_codon:yes stop_codon:yes gene_type:complete